MKKPWEGFLFALAPCCPWEAAGAWRFVPPGRSGECTVRGSFRRLIALGPAVLWMKTGASAFPSLGAMLKAWPSALLEAARCLALHELLAREGEKRSECSTNIIMRQSFSGLTWDRLPDLGSSFPSLGRCVVCFRRHVLRVASTAPSIDASS